MDPRNGLRKAGVKTVPKADCAPVLFLRKQVANFVEHLMNSALHLFRPIQMEATAAAPMPLDEDSTRESQRGHDSARGFDRCVLLLSSRQGWNLMNFQKRILDSIVLIVALTATMPFVFAGDWPQFLGPQRNGHSDETGLIDQWPEAGLKVVFRVPGGVGMSGVSVAGNRVVTLVQDASAQSVICLDANTGNKIWSTPIAPAFKNAMGNGPRSAPALTSDQGFVFTGEGLLAAVDLDSGEKQWEVDVIEEFGGKPAEYGMASSPIFHQGLVIVTAGCPNATVVAFDCKTGEHRWSVGQDRTGYSSPTLLRVAQETQLVVYSGTALLGIDPTEGVLLWRYAYETDYDCNIAMPINVGDDIFISSGENHGSLLLSVSKQGTSYEVEERWASQGRKSVMRNEWQTSIHLDGVLYGFDNVGSAGPITHLTCVDAETGGRKWQESRFGKGNLICADGKLLITTMDGEFVMAKASPDGFAEMGRQKLIGMTRQAPSLANGKVYLRDDTEIVCLDLRQ